MPQMMPLSWLMLFIYFTIMFILFNSMNYYIHLPQKKKMNKMMINMSSMNWKW